MLYMAVVAIANYNQPNLELGYALKFMRLILLVATGLLGLVGLCGRCGVAVFGAGVQPDHLKGSATSILWSPSTAGN